MCGKQTFTSSSLMGIKKWSKHTNRGTSVQEHHISVVSLWPQKSFNLPPKFLLLQLKHWSSGHNQYEGLSILWAAYGSIFAKGSHANYYLLPCKLITQIRCLLNLNNVYRIKQRRKRWKVISGRLWRDAEVTWCSVKHCVWMLLLKSSRVIIITFH